ncbi:MAG TPA: UvrB/UvrC motif-containing protein [Gemmatimonadales bacterium]|nr:UvrB/UvrC motif-containing protein [Gemmatimonadales bacterium]
MVCDNCGEREAAIHLTQIVDNTVTTMHLCEQCAAAKGVETGASVAKFPLGDFLASLGKPGSSQAAEGGADAACPACGGTLQDFRQTGRLGCARCYTTFEAHLRDLLRRLHGSSQHVGERYAATAAPAEPATGPARAVGELREQLRRAIESENFELAAELRDRLKVLE